MLIAFCNQKGGVGKSTLAVHVCVFLHDHGLRVALLDADKQRSSSQWLAEAEPRITIAAADNPDDCLSVGQELLAIHDVVVADGPAGLDDVSRTLLLMAKLALFPVSPSILDLRSVTQATTVLRYAQGINGELPIGAVVLNKMRARGRVSRELAANAPSLGIDIAETSIRELEAFRDAVKEGSVVTRMGPRAKRAAADMNAFCNELFGNLLAEKRNQEVANG